MSCVRFVSVAYRCVMPIGSKAAGSDNRSPLRVARLGMDNSISLHAGPWLKGSDALSFFNSAPLNRRAA